MKKADIFVGCLILFTSVMVFVLTARFAGQSYTGYGPDRFPRFLALIWGVLGLFLIINALRGKFFEEDMKITLFGLKRVGVILGVTIAVLIAMQWLGFLLASIIYVYVVMTYLAERSLIGRVIAAIGIPGAAYVIFRFVMVVPLPRCVFLDCI